MDPLRNRGGTTPRLGTCTHQHEPFHPRSRAVTRLWARRRSDPRFWNENRSRSFFANEFIKPSRPRTGDRVPRAASLAMARPEARTRTGQESTGRRAESARGRATPGVPQREHRARERLGRGGGKKPRIASCNFLRLPNRQRNQASSDRLPNGLLNAFAAIGSPCMIFAVTRDAMSVLKGAGWEAQQVRAGGSAPYSSNADAHTVITILARADPVRRGGHAMRGIHGMVARNALPLLVNRAA